MGAMTLDRLAELMEARFQQIDARFEQVDARFGAVESGLAELRIDMLERFHRVDTRMDRLSELLKG